MTGITPMRIKTKIDIVIAVTVLSLLGIIISHCIFPGDFAHHFSSTGLTWLVMLQFFLVAPLLVLSILIFLLVKRQFIRLLILIAISVITYFLLQFTLKSIWYEFTLKLSLTVFIFLTGIFFVSFHCTAFKYIIIAYGSVTVLFMGPAFFAAALVYSYSPPAVTEKNISFIKEYIPYIQDSVEDQIISLHYKYGYGDHERPSFSFFTEQKDLKLSSQMFKAGFMMVQKVNDMILFYKNVNVILPPGPGFLYSPKGDNPNESQNEQIIKARPYEKITDNWYISRKLVIGEARELYQQNLPDPFIDKSLDIDEEVLNELIMFSEENKKALANTGN